VGLTMATELPRYQIPVRIIDKSSARTDKSKAVTLWSRSLELLDRAGNAEDFISAGLRLHASNFVADGKHLARVDFDGVHSPYAFALSIPNPKQNASWKSAFSHSVSELIAKSNWQASPRPPSR
jgi:2-polyprenyl-6-methoxyphenol hydroxylase-like FAD-dependent oxidoreductase